MADLPFLLTEGPAARLQSAADVEGKLPRALDALGPLTGRDVLLLETPAAGVAREVSTIGARTTVAPLTEPLFRDHADESADVVLSLWSGFRGVRTEDLVATDRVLRPGGRLLVVHDYGRDDVCGLRDGAAPEYGAWSRRDGPFLRDGGFKIRVVHCFWTFGSMEEAAGALGDAFGERGRELAGRLRRPRLAWNVAVYHRARGSQSSGADRA